jgi:hypothetical protein
VVKEQPGFQRYALVVEDRTGLVADLARASVPDMLQWAGQTLSEHLGLNDRAR